MRRSTLIVDMAPDDWNSSCGWKHTISAGDNEPGCAGAAKHRLALDAGE